MEINKLVRELVNTKKKYKDKPLDTFETNIPAMIDDCLEHLRKIERGELAEVMRKTCEYCEDVPSRYRAIRAEGFYQKATDDEYNPEIQVNYCPNCGVKMKG